MAGVQLTYLVEHAKKSAPGHLPEFLHGAFAEARTQVRCVLGRRGIVVAYPDVEVHWDIARPHGLVMSHPGKRFLRCDAPSAATAGGRVRARRTGLRREWPIERMRAAAERWDLTVDGHAIEVWTLTHAVADPVATRALWRLIVPGVPENLAEAGVPAEVLMPEVGRIRLVAVEAADHRVSVQPPNGYVDASYTRPAVGRATVPAREDDDRAVKHPGGGVRLRAATAVETDLAWLTSQESLDELKSILDAVVAPIQEFTDHDLVREGGQPGELGLVVDWWQQLEPHVPDAAVRTALQKLLTAWRIQAGDRPAGLTAAERRRYDQIVLDPQPCPGLSTASCRILRFLTTFLSALDPTDPQAAFRRIYQAEWARATRPRVVSFGITEISQDVGPGGVTHFRAYNFSGTTLTLGGQPLVRTLGFRDGKVRLVLRLPHVETNFDFETKPASNANSILCAIFTLGLCAAAISSSGSGSFTIDNLRLAIDLTPSAVDRYGTVYLDASLDRDASGMDIDFSLVGFNVLEDLVVAIANARDLWDDQISGPILDQVGELVSGQQLRDIVDTVFSWPWRLNIHEGPPVLASGSSFVRGSGTMLARLANTAGLMPAFPVRVTPHRDEPFALAFTPRYLSAWSKEHVGAYDASTEITPDWAGALGIPDPDPADYDPQPPRLQLPGHRRDTGRRTDGGPLDSPPDLSGLVEGCDAPPQLPAAYQNRTVLVRGALTVTLPPAGEATMLARLGLAYRVRFEPTRLLLVHHRVVVDRTVCVDTTRLDDGPPLRDSFANLDAVAVSRIAGGRLPGGLTASQYALRQQVIDHTRLAVAAQLGVLEPDSIAPGAAVVVDPPPDQPGRPPDLPRPGGDRPGRPGVPGGGERDLPTVICEPPHCDWLSGIDQSSLGLYLEATAHASVDIEVGFDPNPDAALWMPGVSLRAVPESLTVDVTSVDAEGPYRDVDRQALTDAVHAVLTDDAQRLLDPLLSLPAPVAERPLVPPAAAILGSDTPIPDEVLRVVVYTQAAGGGSLSYRIGNDVAYWPIRVEQHVTDIIRQ